MPYPTMTKDLHHEMELVVALGTGGADIPVADALSHVWGYAAGLDMTRRDLQVAGQEHRPPMGHGQGLRPLRADRHPGAGRPRSRIPTAA